MNQNKMKKTIFTILFVVIFLITPAVLLAYPKYVDHVKHPQIQVQALEKAKHTNQQELAENQQKLNVTNEQIQQLEQAKQETGNNQNTPYSLKEEKFNQIYQQTGVTYDFAQVHPISSIPSDTTLNTNLLRGRVYIPKVALDLPVLEGVSNENLYVGASTMKPNQVLGQGNYALAGHLMPDASSLFSPLTSVKNGDIVYVTDSHYSYQYKVNNIAFISKYDGNVIDDVANKKMITLITCSDLAGSGRLMVQGEFIGKQLL